MNKRHFLSTVTLVILLFLSFASFAQIPSNGQKAPVGINLQNLAKVKVDDLTDDQIREFWKQAQERGLSLVQIQQVATQRGMTNTEFNKLKTRIEIIDNEIGGGSKYEDNTEGRKVEGKTDNRRDKDGVKMTKEEEFRSKIFGADLFSSKDLTFEPDLKMATPQNYQLGPDDELVIDISGYSEANYRLKVSPDGQIRIPVVGPINVGGLTIEQAKTKIIKQLSSGYEGISSGETSVSITLGNIRSIKVTIVGEVAMPGTYTLPSLATAFNALYVSGGPNKNGSFRSIKVLRNGKQIATIDVYEFLLKGQAKGNVRLQDQDVIMVGAYETRVELKGEVKRDGFYEVTKNETLKDVIGFAGGYSDIAYKDRIKVFRNTGKEKSVADVPQDVVAIFIPQTGDQYIIDKVLERFANRVQINGAVFRPGFFALEEGLTLSKLIKKAEGLTEEAFTSRGLIYRLKDDNSLEAISFDVNEVMSEQKDILLKREDNVQILSKLEMREDYTVSIAGEVISPGIYPYAENLRVEDLIITSGGLKESASKTKIEIARKIKNIDVNDVSAPVASIVSYEIFDDLKTKEGNTIFLQPFDVVSIYKLPGYYIQRNITLEGEVTHPGQYTLTRNNERISEVIARAGGVTASAYSGGAILIRTKKLSATDQFIKKKKLESLEKQSSDSTRAKDIAEADLMDNSSIVGIELDRILKNPGSSYDLIMDESDVLKIPRMVQTVTVSGEVLYPVKIQYKKGRGFKRYVSGAGGYTERALKRRGYVVYANGSAESTKKFLFVNIHPKIKPGAEIILPAKDERKKLSAIEFVGISSALSSMVLLIYTISR
jgi:protein involved in polysaccharide export with SLBB domain